MHLVAVLKMQEFHRGRGGIYYHHLRIVAGSLWGLHKIHGSQVEHLLHYVSHCNPTPVWDSVHIQEGALLWELRERVRTKYYKTRHVICLISDDLAKIITSICRSDKLLHVIVCLVFPAIFRDWDIEETEDINVYESRWHEVEKEHLFMAIWHGIINLIMTAPMVFASVKILIHYPEIEGHGFEPLKDEQEAWTTAIILLCMPAAILLISILNWVLIKVYYKAGHPWARIWKEFLCNKSPSTNEKAV